MNFLQLRTLVWAWLDDLNGTYFLESQVNTWLNNAYQELQKQLLQNGEYYYAVTSETNTVNGVYTYSLPSDFLKCHQLEIVTSGTGLSEIRQMIYPVTYVQLDKFSQTTGSPMVYCVKKDCFTMRPYPDNIYTLKLTYSPRVQPMTANSDIPDAPAQYHQYIAILATLDGFFKDQRDPGPFLEKKNYYEALMKQDSQNRRVDAPRSVVITEDVGFGGYWY